MSERGIFGRLATILAIFDLVVVVSYLGPCVWLGFAELDFAIATSLARISIWVVALRVMTAPIERWLRGRGHEGDGSDEYLQALDSHFSRLSTRFAWIYAGTWIACEAGWAVHSFARAGVSIGGAEILAATALTATLLLSVLSVESLIEQATAAPRTLLRQEIDARRLTVNLGKRSIPRTVARLCMTLAALLFFGGTSVGNLWRVQELRAGAATEQRRLAEVSAVMVDNAEPPLDGVSIVAGSELPGQLRGAARDVDPNVEAVTSVDAWHGQASAAAPVADGRWALATAPIDERAQIYVGFILLMLVAAPPIVWIGGWAYGKQLAAPLEQLSGAAEAFVERGELAALGRLVAFHDDEVRRLAASFNGMLDFLAELAEAAEHVAAGDLRVTVEAPGPLHHAFRGMLAQLNTIVSSMRETALELASAAAELIALAHSQDEVIQQQASAMEQVNRMVMSLSRAAVQINDTAGQVRADAEVTLTTTDEMLGRVTELQTRAASIGDLLRTIEEVAARSDLLALNGSLEATRAGEAGRGFALVAAEMRRLAERVQGAVGVVGEEVRGIDLTGSQTLAATGRSRALAEQTVEAARSISELTERQSADTHEAAAGVEQVAKVVVDAARGISQTRAAAEGLRLHAETLARALAVFELVEGDADEPDSARV